MADTQTKLYSITSELGDYHYLKAKRDYWNQKLNEYKAIPTPPAEEIQAAQEALDNAQAAEQDAKLKLDALDAAWKDMLDHYK